MKGQWEFRYVVFNSYFKKLDDIITETREEDSRWHYLGVLRFDIVDDFDVVVAVFVKDERMIKIPINERQMTRGLWLCPRLD